MITSLKLYNDESITIDLNDIYNNLILISGRHKDLKKQINAGIISEGGISIEKNRIRHSLLQLIEAIPDNNLIEKTVSEKINKTTLIAEVGEKVYDIFLCYSSFDTHFADEIWKHLTQHGYKVFYSHESLKSNIGNSYFTNISNALKNSTHFLLIVSKNSMESEWVKSEYETFYNETYINSKGERKIFILKGNEFSFESIPYLLKRIQIAEDKEQLLIFLGFTNQNFHKNNLTEKHGVFSRAMERLNFTSLEGKSNLLLIGCISCILVFLGFVYYGYWADNINENNSIITLFYDPLVITLPMLIEMLCFSVLFSLYGNFFGKLLCMLQIILSLFSEFIWKFGYDNIDIDKQRIINEMLWNFSQFIFLGISIILIVILKKQRLLAILTLTFVIINISNAKFGVYDFLSIFAGNGMTLQQISSSTHHLFWGIILFMAHREIKKAANTTLTPTAAKAKPQSQRRRRYA